MVVYKLNMKKILLLLLFLITTKAFASFPGTANGTAVYAAGKFSQALSDSHNFYVSFSSAPTNLSVTSGGTYAFWFNTSSSAGSLGLAYGSGVSAWSIQMTSSGYLSLSTQSNQATRVTSKAFNDGSWHYVALVLDIFNDIKLYVDGTYYIKVANNTTALTLTGIAAASASTSTSWSGLLDDFAVYNYDIYNSNNTPPTVLTAASTPGLVALYRFENDLTDSNTGYTNVTPGTIYRTFVSTTANTITTVAPTGGTGPYTYQWQSAPDNAGLPGTMTNITGAISSTLTKTGLTAGTIYWYQLVITDNASNSITSAPIKATTKSTGVLVLGFIGDSITEGYNLSSGQDAATLLCNQLSNYNGTRTVDQVNKAQIGKATSDFTTGGSLFPWALAAFKAYGVDIVCYMFGTNDSNSTYNIPASTFNTNITSECGSFVSNGFKVVINFPPYPNDGRSGTQISLLQSYLPFEQALAAANVGNIYMGDINYYNISQANSVLYPAASSLSFYQSDGLHPNVTGAAVLAQACWFYTIGVVPGIIKIVQSGSLNY